MDKIDEILKKNEELNLLIMKTNSSLNKINEKSEILNKALNNIKTIYKEENNQNNYIKNFVCFFCIVIILAISIYILELKYEKQNNKSEKNIELNDIDNTNIINQIPSRNIDKDNQNDINSEKEIKLKSPSKFT